MLTMHNQGMYYKNGSFIPAQDGPAAGLPAPEEARKGTMAYLRHPEGPQHPGRYGPPGHPLRRHGLP